MTLLEILEASRARVANGWTRGWYAKNAEQRDVNWEDPDAVCWCAAGAIYAATGIEYSRLGEASLAKRDQYEAACAALDVGYVPDWNDKAGRTQAQVIKAFDKAIARARNAAPAAPKEPQP